MTRIITAEEAARILNSLPMYSEPGIIGDLARTVVEMEKERDEVWDRYMMWTAAAETVAKEHAAAHERAAKAEAERDRLRDRFRDVLAAERFERAPEGWDNLAYKGKWQRDLPDGGWMDARRNGWKAMRCSDLLAEGAAANILDAIDAADEWAQENA